MTELDQPHSLRREGAASGHLNFLSITEERERNANGFPENSSNSSFRKATFDQNKSDAESKENGGLTIEQLHWEKESLRAKCGNSMGADLSSLFGHPSELTADLGKGILNEISEHPGKLAFTALLGMGAAAFTRELPNLGVTGKIAYGLNIAVGLVAGSVFGLDAAAKIGKDYRMLDQLKQNSGPKQLENMLHEDVQKYGNSLAETSAALLGASSIFATNKASLYGFTEARASRLVDVPTAITSAFESPLDSNALLKKISGKAD